MSAAWALIKFKKTGNIYYGCYEGTSDVLIPYICTPEECYNKETDCYCPISYCRELAYGHDKWEFSVISNCACNSVEDLDEVEIYADYGGGFYWTGEGSETLKMIKDPLDPWESNPTYKDGIPNWAGEILSKEH